MGNKFAADQLEGVKLHTHTHGWGERALYEFHVMFCFHVCILGMWLFDSLEWNLRSITQDYSSSCSVAGAALQTRPVACFLPIAFVRAASSGDNVPLDESVTLPGRGSITLHTWDFTLSTLHFPFPLHTPHFTLHTVHSPLCTPHSTLHTPHATLYTLDFPPRTLHCTLHTPHFTFYTQPSPTQHSTIFSHSTALCFFPHFLHSTVCILHWYSNRRCKCARLFK